MRIAPRGDIPEGVEVAGEPPYLWEMEPPTTVQAALLSHAFSAQEIAALARASTQACGCPGIGPTTADRLLNEATVLWRAHDLALARLASTAPWRCR